MISVKILGSGCTRCKELERMCNEIVSQNNLNAKVEKVTDLKEIMSYGIMQTPGLVINEVVKLSGKLPTKSTLLHWIQELK